MDIKYYYYRIKEIREKVVNNIDYHFKEYMMIDIVGQKELETIIDEMDWYGYWKEVALDIKFIMDDLLEFTGLVYDEGLSYEKDSTENILLSEILEYKIICDKHITSNIHYSRENVEEEVLGFTKEIKTNEKLPKVEVINDQHKQDIIKVIHSYLVDKEYIESIKLKTFKTIFNDDSSLTPIKWTSDAIRFVAFINLLLNKKVVKLTTEYKDSYWEYFRQIFLDKNGNQYTTKHLGNRRIQPTYAKKYDGLMKDLLPLLTPYLSDTNPTTN